MNVVVGRQESLDLGCHTQVVLILCTMSCQVWWWWLFQRWWLEIILMINRHRIWSINAGDQPEKVKILILESIFFFCYFSFFSNKIYSSGYFLLLMIVKLKLTTKGCKNARWPANCIKQNKQATWSAYYFLFRAVQWILLYFSDFVQCYGIRAECITLHLTIISVYYSTFWSNAMKELKHSALRCI